jgi:hypothetical protein
VPLLERALAALLLTAAAGAVLAQNAGGASGWTESAVPPPPPLHTRGLITLDMGKDARLHFGVDPISLAISADGVVRYVVVASSNSGSGAVNAMYEGLRCATSEIKTYARTTTAGDWHPVEQAHWRSIYASSSTRYAIVLAEQGLCNGKAPARSVDAMVQQLKGPPLGQQRYY